MGIREVRTAASSTHSANRIVGRDLKRFTGHTFADHPRIDPSAFSSIEIFACMPDRFLARGIQRPVGGIFAAITEPAPAGRDSAHTYLLGIPQPVIEQLLEDHAIELGAQIRRGCASPVRAGRRGRNRRSGRRGTPRRLRLLDRRTPAEPEPPPLPLVRRTHQPISPAQFSPRFRCHRSPSACISRRRRAQRSRSGGQIVDIISTAPMNPWWIRRRYLRIHHQRWSGQAAMDPDSDPAG